MVLIYMGLGLVGSMEMDNDAPNNGFRSTILR